MKILTPVRMVYIEFLLVYYPYCLSIWYYNSNLQMKNCMNHYQLPISRGIGNIILVDEVYCSTSYLEVLYNLIMYIALSKQGYAINASFRSSLEQAFLVNKHYYFKRFTDQCDLIVFTTLWKYIKLVCWYIYLSIGKLCPVGSEVEQDAISCARKGHPTHKK